ncbi:hypothetical protein NC651_025243 [Populus alba x Populus x berolinensis]|nr:hypothetical protein NC651_025243 [Populus alba x Populus x berolinensis]
MDEVDSRSTVRSLLMRTSSLKHTGPGKLALYYCILLVLAMTDICQWQMQDQTPMDHNFSSHTVVTSWLDGHHVVFGKVLSGMDIIYKIEAEGNQNGVPRHKVVVSDSGEMPL